MSDPARTISHEELVELQKKFSEIKHSINNALAVMMALSEMSQRRPDYSKSLPALCCPAPQIVSSLQEFTQPLTKAGPKRKSFLFAISPITENHAILRLFPLLRGRRWRRDVPLGSGEPSGWLSTGVDEQLGWGGDDFVARDLGPLGEHAAAASLVFHQFTLSRSWYCPCGRKDERRMSKEEYGREPTGDPW